MAEPRVQVTDAPPAARKKSHYSTTVEDDDLEFIQAIEDYKRATARPFPSWSEVLRVLKGLGYRKSSDRSDSPE